MNPSAVEELYRHYGYAVHRRCGRILHSPSAADDALQEVFVRVLRHEPTSSVEQPLAWLYRIADNVCFDRLGRDKRSHARQTDMDALSELPAPGHEARPDQRQLLLELLSRARPRERRTAMLYYFDGLNHAENAGLLGCSREAVTLRLGKFHDEARKHLTRGEPR